MDPDSHNLENAHQEVELKLLERPPARIYKPGAYRDQAEPNILRDVHSCDLRRRSAELRHVQARSLSAINSTRYRARAALRELLSRFDPQS